MHDINNTTSYIIRRTYTSLELCKLLTRTQKAHRSPAKKSQQATNAHHVVRTRFPVKLFNFEVPQTQKGLNYLVHMFGFPLFGDLLFSWFENAFV